MQPNQNTNPNTEKPAEKQGPSPLRQSGSKIIQPISKDFIEEQDKLNISSQAPAPTIQPNSTPTSPQAPQTQNPEPPTPNNSIYPEPQTPQYGSTATQSNFYAQKEAETAKKKNRKKIVLLTTIIVLVLAVLCGGGGYYYWYSKQDHSIYAKLTKENYSQNGVTLSFLYPSILKYDGAELTKLQNQAKNNSSVQEYVVYDYQKGSPQQIGITVNSVRVDGILKELGLTPEELLNQIKAGSGSFVNAINKKNSQAFSGYFNGCGGSVTNNSNQTVITCYESAGGKVIEHLVGVDNTYQYNFYLVMPNSVWQDHQKVWQKVEKSFTY